MGAGFPRAPPLPPPAGFNFAPGATARFSLGGSGFLVPFPPRSEVSIGDSSQPPRAAGRRHLLSPCPFLPESQAPCSSRPPLPFPIGSFSPFSPPFRSPGPHLRLHRFISIITAKSKTKFLYSEEKRFKAVVPQIWAPQLWALHLTVTSPESPWGLGAHVAVLCRPDLPRGGGGEACTAGPGRR